MSTSILRTWNVCWAIFEKCHIFWERSYILYTNSIPFHGKPTCMMTDDVFTYICPKKLPYVAKHTVLLECIMRSCLHVSSQPPKLSTCPYLYRIHVSAAGFPEEWRHRICGVTHPCWSYGRVLCALKWKNVCNKIRIHIEILSGVDDDNNDYCDHGDAVVSSSNSSSSSSSSSSR